jgi:hypoxanthine phosphoribosyltransferase
MGQIKDDMIPFLKEEDILKIVNRLAMEIERDYAGKEIHLICPLKGSVIFVSDLMRRISLKQKVDFVHLVDTEKKGSIKINLDISSNLKGKHVLIVEEIIDVGRTLSFLRDRIKSSQPASLKIVTLLDKPARRELPIRPDYVGLTIDDRYVVGYGMDSEEAGRNYGDIYYYTM